MIKPKVEAISFERFAGQYLHCRSNSKDAQGDGWCDRCPGLESPICLGALLQYRDRYIQENAGVQEELGVSLSQAFDWMNQIEKEIVEAIRSRRRSGAKAKKKEKGE